MAFIPEGRRRALDLIGDLNEKQFDHWGDPEIHSKINQYEMAFRMQTSVPEAVDLADEPDYIFDLYGEDARQPGTYAANCLLARRLAERGVRFIQLYHMGWDPARRPAQRESSANAATPIRLRRL
jgi:hypothetical protein